LIFIHIFILLQRPGRVKQPVWKNVYDVAAKSDITDILSCFEKIEHKKRRQPG